MANIIPKHIYKTIEYRLHMYEIMKIRIQEWQASIQSADRTPQTVRGQGFYSDPTAMSVIKLLNPPKSIREDMCWVELIDRAKDYFLHCKDPKRAKLFDIWYGQPRQSILSAANKIPIGETTFKNWRDDIVLWMSNRAAQHKLIHFE